MRRRLAIGLVSVLVAVVTGVSTAAPATAATQSCLISGSVARANGDIGFVDVLDGRPSHGTIYVSIARGLPPGSIIGGLTTTPYRGFNWWRDLAIRGGSLWSDDTLQPEASGSGDNRPPVSRRLGTGWGGVTKLVDVSGRDSTILRGGFAYALNPTSGTLARYAVSEPSIGAVRVRSSGVRPGYAGFRGLGLAFVLERDIGVDSDVLVATTRQGGLYLIEAPHTPTFAPRVIPLRTSSWTFDDVFVDACYSERPTTSTIVAIRTGTHEAYAYRLGRTVLTPTGGTSSSIVSLGAVRGGWDAVSSSVAPGFGGYHIRGVHRGDVLP